MQWQGTGDKSLNEGSSSGEGEENLLVMVERLSGLDLITNG